MEAYYEGPDSTFTHCGDDYSVDTLITLSKDIVVSNYPVSAFAWMIDGQTFDQARVDRTDLTIPILVTQCSEGMVTLDGFHRLLKAFQHGQLNVRAKYVPFSVLVKCKIRNKRVV